MRDNEKSSITQCKDSNGRIIDQCVARDTYRCLALEDTYPKVKVFTVNKCTDTLRLCDNTSDPYNINSDVCTNQFRGLIRDKNWSFNEIYLDTIRMYPQYVEHCFGKKFFSTLCLMKSENVLVDEKDNNGKIYLPFIPHFFMWLTVIKM